MPTGNCVPTAGHHKAAERTSIIIGFAGAKTVLKGAESRRQRRRGGTVGEGCPLSTERHLGEVLPHSHKILLIFVSTWGILVYSEVLNSKYFCINKGFKNTRKMPFGGF